MSALQLGRIWASSPESPNVDPGADKYKLGWVAEIPVLQMLNYINNRYDTNIVALAERGVFEWGNDVTYNTAAIAWDESDGFIYVSKVAAPSTASRPGLNATQWDKSAIQISRKQYDDAVAAWSNHIVNTSNPHGLTTEILNTYSKSVIDAKVAVAQAVISAHIGNTANPHGTTALQVGAVPVTGGDYTGLVRHLFASIGIGATSYAAYLLTDATGSFLALGATAKLGIDSTKVAVFIDDVGLKSPLLLESNYIAAREAVESAYVPPVPDCEVNFRNNLNLLYGSGTVLFTGPASSRGYLDKAGVARTAALNAPRYTAQGLYVTNNIDAETLSIPTDLNIKNADNYTWSMDFRSTASSTNFLVYAIAGASRISGVRINGTDYVYQSVVGGVTTTYIIGPVDHTTNHKVVVVSDAVLNKTFVYLDGLLKVIISTKQDAMTGDVFIFSYSTSARGAQYLNNFKTWLVALTAQQVSNI